MRVQMRVPRLSRAALSARGRAMVGIIEPMRSLPMRSRPIRGKRPRYIGGRPSPGSRPKARQRVIRRAVARATRPPRPFPGRPRPGHRHPPDRDRAHRARRAGAPADHDPATRSRPGRPARGAAERPGLGARRRGVALTQRGRAAPTTGPAPCPLRAAEDRPVLRRPYFVFSVCRSGTTTSTDAIFISRSPPPAAGARRITGVKGDTKEFLSVGNSVSEEHA